MLKIRITGNKTCCEQKGSVFMEIKEFSVREVNIALDPSWTPTNLQVIFKKIDETRFRVCGIRYRFGGDSVQKLYGIFDYVINISGAPADRTDNILKRDYPGGIEEVKETFGSEANYVIADSWIPYIVPLNPYEVEEEYISEDEALRAMQEYIKTELNGEQPEFEKHKQIPSCLMRCINTSKLKENE